MTKQHKNAPPEQDSLKALQENAENLASPAVLMHATDNGLVTEQSIFYLRSSQAHYAQSMGEMHIASGEHISINASQKISLLSQKEGVRFVSGNGPFEIESHADKLDAIALKDITVQSTQGHIQLTAKNGITLGCGGGYIRIAPDGQIEIHSPSRISLKGQHVWDGPQGQDFHYLTCHSLFCKECLQEALKNVTGVAFRE
ncbi:DUF2345 domain-containing protein [Providencia hangzhouensis]